MLTETDYLRLIEELEAIEKATGAYLCDINIDGENVEVSPGDPEFWECMCSAACLAAGIRAEEAGLDINRLIGRTIY